MIQRPNPDGSGTHLPYAESNDRTPKPDDQDEQGPRPCACDEYIAENAADLDEHILAMMHVDDGRTHA